jgi:hypothetical protein
MNSCEEHGDCVIAYNKSPCPLCECEDNLNEMEKERNSLREEVEELQHELKGNSNA